jgi:hypothetical protein
VIVDLVSVSVAEPYNFLPALYNAIKSVDSANVNRTWPATIAIAALTDSLIWRAEMDVKLVTAIQSAHLTPPVTFEMGNAFAVRVLLVFDAILVLPTNSDSLTMDVNLVNATPLDPCRFSVTIPMDNVDAEITSKAVAAIVAKKTNTIVKLDVKTVHLVTIWYKRLSINTEPRWLIWQRYWNASSPIRPSLRILILIGNWPKSRTVSISSGWTPKCRVAVTKASVSSWKS